MPPFGPKTGNAFSDRHHTGFDQYKRPRLLSMTFTSLQLPTIAPDNEHDYFDDDHESLIRAP